MTIIRFLLLVIIRFVLLVDIVDSFSFFPMKDTAEKKLLQLSQAHFTSQALYAIVKLGVPNLFQDSTDTTMSIDEIVSALHPLSSTSTNNNNTVRKDALLRTLRLLTSVGIFNQSVCKENKEVRFSLTETGLLLSSEKACFVQHWMDPALWASWPFLHDYITGDLSTTPFEHANQGMTIVDYMEQNDNAKRVRNRVAKLISQTEIDSILNSLDGDLFSGKTVVDIGGGYGELSEALIAKFPTIQKCYNLDLAHVIDEVSDPPKDVHMVKGDMFIPSTIPECNIIIMKHVFCDWNEEKAIDILKSIHQAVSSKNRETVKIIIIDALLMDGPDANDSMQVMSFVDVQMMMVGSGKMERSKSQMEQIAEEGGFQFDSVTQTSSISCDITILSKK